MLKRKTTGEAIDKAVKRSLDFENTIADMARRSEKRAWRVAGASLVMSFVLAGGVIYLMPFLERREPYLIMADAYTGTASVARLSSGSDFVNMRASEAVNRSNIVHYVLARESYDSGAISERDWRTVYTMSAPKVREQVRTERNPSNPQSAAAMYGPNRALRVRILSVTPLGASQGRPPTSATVRFQRVLFEKASGNTRVLDNKIATMEFEYKPDIRMNDADSVENPLRFQVTSYRVDNDASTLVPTETALAPAVASPLPAAPSVEPVGQPIDPAALPATAAPATVNRSPAPAVATESP
ncbi:virB8 family protein [Thermomonas fusca]|uniref:virB8 family protein n=1 Tax=Thermomonas fusca TaxID=215690 RepID=UPI0003FF7808|nr:type IV secretion system protein [Thermomonas fusca]